MGIHSGELNEKTSAAIINVTTKITALAEGGEILVSKRTIKKIRASNQPLKDIDVVDARKQKGGNKVFRVLSPLLQYRLENLDTVQYPVHRIPSTQIPSVPSMISITSMLPPLTTSVVLSDNEHKEASTRSSSHSDIAIEAPINSLAMRVLDSNTATSSLAVPSNPPTIHLNLYGVDEDQLSRMEIDQQTLLLTEKQMLAEFGSFTENWFIPFEQLKLKKKIGEGSFGEVWKAKWRGTTVAVKRFFKQQKNDHIMLELRKESTIMRFGFIPLSSNYNYKPNKTYRDLRHPNILLFLGSCIRPPNLCIVTQYMPNGCVVSIAPRESTE